jgi:transposase
MKSSEQLAVLALHRARQGFVKARTAQATSYVVCWQNTGSSSLKALPTLAMHLPEILEEYENGLPGTFRQLLERLGEHLKALDRQVQELEVQLQSWHRENAASKKLA